MILRGFRDTRPPIYGDSLISRLTIQQYFGGRNERRETDLVRSREQKEEWLSPNDGSADDNEYADV